VPGVGVPRSVLLGMVLQVLKENTPFAHFHPFDVSGAVQINIQSRGPSDWVGTDNRMNDFDQCFKGPVAETREGNAPRLL
jgi:hypothetical protein